jgi:hypothetical protein
MQGRILDVILNISVFLAVAGCDIEIGGAFSGNRLMPVVGLAVVCVGSVIAIGAIIADKLNG